MTRGSGSKGLNHFRLGAIIVAALSLLTTPVALSGASAQADLHTGLQVSVTDGASKAECELSATSVDYDQAIVKGWLQANIRPARMSGYVRNIHVHLVCWVEADAEPGARLGTNRLDADGFRTSGGVHVALPQHPSYRICMQTETTLKSGAQRTSEVTCAT